MQGVGVCQNFFMSWSDIFPIMDDEMVKSYCAEATEKERSILAQYFSIEEKYNMRESKHVVATSLFAKAFFSAWAHLP